MALRQRDGDFGSSTNTSPEHEQLMRSNHQIENPRSDNDNVSNPTDSSLDKQDHAKPRKLWNPLWLDRRVLVAFSLLYLLMVGALILLFYWSESHQGLGLVYPRLRRKVVTKLPQHTN